MDQFQDLSAGEVMKIIRETMGGVPVFSNIEKNKLMWWLGRNESSPSGGIMYQLYFENKELEEFEDSVIEDYIGHLLESEKEEARRRDADELLKEFEQEFSDWEDMWNLYYFKLIVEDGDEEVQSIGKKFICVLDRESKEADKSGNEGALMKEFQEWLQANCEGTSNSVYRKVSSLRMNDEMTTYSDIIRFLEGIPLNMKVIHGL